VLRVIARALGAIGLQGIDELGLGERMSKKDGGESRSVAPQAGPSAERIHATKDKLVLSDDDVAKRGFLHEPSQSVAARREERFRAARLMKKR
jgi:hypothetical protein